MDPPPHTHTSLPLPPYTLWLLSAKLLTKDVRIHAHTHATATWLSASLPPPPPVLPSAGPPTSCRFGDRPVLHGVRGAKSNPGGVFRR